MATLTGACVVALGDRTRGLMATTTRPRDAMLDAAEAAGEDLWQLPIPKEIRGKLESKVADLRSTGADRAGGALVAAAFLREFVPAGTGLGAPGHRRPGVPRRAAATATSAPAAPGMGVRTSSRWPAPSPS